mgnify:CR=1 FL=1
MKDKFDKVFELMQASFPEDEYRDYNSQKQLLSIPCYRLITKMDSDDNLVGFIATWQTENFSFIEHFAVNPNLRGKGIGSEMLKDFIKNSSKPIILEVELPTDIISKKRISFYKRHGFVLNEFKYFQMPLRKDSQPIQLYLMSLPKPLKEEEFEKIKSSIHQKIYGVN